MSATDCDLHQTRRMSRADRLKEEIGWLKIVFAVAAALDASIVAWLVRAYNTVSRPIAAAGLIAAVTLAAIVVFVNFQAYRRIKEMENL